jgi:rhodanese-related sulfurtransferase
MQPQTSIRPNELQQHMLSGASAYLLDVRTPPEYATVHVPGARLIPLDELDPVEFSRDRRGGSSPIFVLCQSGGRARKAIEKLEKSGVQGSILVEGGIQAWIDAGLPVNRGTSRVIPLMRQVQIIIGFISALGAALALTMDTRFALIPLLTGCGLLFAGITGFCGLALLLTKMPWNKSHRIAPVGVIE